MAEKLTKRTVDRLIAEADADRDTLVWDAAVPGLVLRLRSGSARFAFQYKRRDRTRRVMIGAYSPLTLDQARDQARALYAKIHAGTDSAEEKGTERAKRVLFAEMLAATLLWQGCSLEEVLPAPPPERIFRFCRPDGGDLVAAWSPVRQLGLLTAVQERGILAARPRFSGRGTRQACWRST